MSEHVRLLLVEDSEDDARLILRELERGGYELTWKRVESEADFVAALEESWDIIVSDFQMPHFNGLRAFAVYRELELDIPFIFVSGALGEERAVEAMRAGARDYLLKDNLARLGVAVKRELAAARSRRAQRRAEAVALRDQRRLGMAVEASGAGIFEYRIPVGPETHYDARWARVLGHAPEELPPPEALGGWLLERIEPEEQPLVRDTYEQFMTGRSERLDFEVRLRHGEGHFIHVGVSAHAVRRDEDGRATHVVGVLLDLTERRRLEAQFRQSQKMEAIGRLAGGVAHDVNNLLSVIVMSGQFALQAIDDEHPARPDVEEVLQAASRISSLTEQLLAFSRSRPIVPRVLDVNGIIEDIDRMLRRLVGKDVQLETRLAPRLRSVRMDPGSLEQVVTNLSVNARDAMPDGGRLTIESANLHVAESRRVHPDIELPAGDYIVIRVGDTGVGMDELTQRKIFEPFFTTKGPGKGTGLGLATCYGIVKQSGGYIGVESDVGRGTTFSVYLPSVAEVPDEPAPRIDRTVQSLRGSESILVAEDDEAVRRTVVRVLSGLGYRVTAAGSGLEAIRACDKNKGLDLLLTDMLLPDMTGSQLIDQVRYIRPAIKVVRMSGYTPNEMTRQGVSLTHTETPFLQKPFTPEQVARAVREALEG